MRKTVVINVVGLTPGLVGAHTPFLSQWAAQRSQTTIEPVLPAVTCSAQATYLTGKWPNEHGIVGNGWYYRSDAEVKFWKQSNHLIQAPKIWEEAKQRDPSFTSCNMFWWFNMYSSVDFSVTPRPNYLADGRKIPDIYTHPANLREQLNEKLGPFPLFDFWGPKTSIKSSQWIADASVLNDQLNDPTLTLIYLPHLDYNLQRFGPTHESIVTDLKEIDGVCQQLIGYYEGKGAEVVVLSEYGITAVNRPIHLNRVLRNEGYLAIREEQGWELLDAGASKAFAVADHQLAHIYLNDASVKESVKTLLEQQEGVELVLDEAGKKEYHLDHPRAGDLVVVADANSWFTYYYWLNDAKAPDFARTVDIHRKPGYDPVEMFLDPNISMPLPTIGWKLAKKKMGFRQLMDVIPLDASLVGGSHGRFNADPSDQAILIGNHVPKNTVAPTAVYDILLQTLGA